MDRRRIYVLLDIRMFVYFWVFFLAVMHIVDQNQQHPYQALAP